MTIKHKTYRLIVQSIQRGGLTEPFNEADFRRSCPSLPDGTYKAFLHKHSRGNPGGRSELFIRVRPGMFRCIRPFKYGL